MDICTFVTGDDDDAFGVNVSTSLRGVSRRATSVLHAGAVGSVRSSFSTPHYECRSTKQNDVQVAVDGK